MITNFKKYQFLTEDVATDLANQFDYDFVIKWHKKNYNIDVSEIISMSSHQSIMNCFDGDKYLKDWIRDYINSYSFSEFDEDDLKRYIKENIDDSKETKILEIYNKNNYDENDEDSEKETEYDEYMVDELDKSDLQEVIEFNGDEDNCTEWIIHSWYDGYDGEDLFDEMFGLAKRDGKYGVEYCEYEYGSFKAVDSSKLYKKAKDYINTKKLKKDWLKDIEFETKTEDLGNAISYTPRLQRYLIKKNPDNVDSLIDLWKEDNFSGKNIGSEYKFQKAYINKYIKDNIDEDDMDDEDEEYRTTLIEDALEFLHKNFGVNDKIEKEYEPYMWKITAQYKFNL